MTKEVEDMIRHKSWEELTASERSLVNDWAPNEEEYGQLRWFLAETSNAFQHERISARPSLKKGVMAEFDQTDRKPVIWLNTVGSFLLPEGKKIHQKPGVQLAVAAVLLVGFLWLFQMDLNDTEIVQHSADVNQELPVLDDTVEQSDFMGNMQEELLEKEKNESINATKEADSSKGDLLEEWQQETAFNIAEADMDSLVFVEESFGNDKLTTLAPRLETRVKEEAQPDEAFMDVTTLSEAEAAEPEDAPEVIVLDDMEDHVVVNESETVERTDESRKKTMETGNIFNNTRTFSSEATADVQGLAGQATVSEEILPKSVHINQTKELKNLFFTVK